MSQPPLWQRTVAPQLSSTQPASQFAPTQLKAARTLTTEQLSLLAHNPVVQGYRIIRDLAGGGFAKVYLARKDGEGTLGAIKVVLRQDEAADKRVHKEMRIHATLRHPNVLRMLGHEEDDANTTGRPEWGNVGPAFYLALEYACGGDLFDKIAPDVGVNEDIAQCFFTQLLNALRYCHSKGICHRDIKPENILIDSQASIKLCDFGLSAVYRLKGQERPLAEPCGSLPYAAPELAHGKPYRAEPVDVWSTGALLFTMLLGNTPWDQATAASAEYQMWLDGTFLQTELRRRLSPNVQSLLKKMLAVDPTKRITFEQIAKHRWAGAGNPLITQAGEVAHPNQLYQRLMEGLARAGIVHEPDGGFVQEAEDDMDLDMPTIANTAGARPSLMISTAGSLMATSQRRNMAFNYFVTYEAPETVVERLRYCLADSLAAPAHAEPLEAGIHGLSLPIALIGGLKGTIQIRHEIPQQGLGLDGVDLYSVLFVRAQGDSLKWSRMHDGIRRQFEAAGLVVKTPTGALEVSQRMRS